ncbi:hypothetical protein Pla52n_12660 [Stieleria varia]|uniref:Uncharacterized protein n=1 Tax=Stieleria varia TaxID=2528005 RepID=A0A5C6B2B3_9BACT|nr:hypothetical protein Pla52n_12660 [Stieleria varia]
MNQPASQIDKRMLFLCVISFCVPGCIRTIDSVFPFLYLLPRPLGLPQSTILLALVFVGMCYVERRTRKNRRSS